MPPTTETQEISKKPAKTPTKNLGPIQLQKITKNTRHHTKLINWKDNLQKMECKLKKMVNFKLQNMVRQMVIKKLMDFLPVDICYIGAVEFYQNLVQSNIIAFTTSLYKID